MEIMRDLVEAAVARKSRRSLDYISPSSLGGCMRAHWLEIKKYPKTTPPTTPELLNFEVGNVWEEVIVKLLKANNVDITHHRRPWFVEEYGVKGTPDISIRTENKHVLVDAKTMKSKWFWYLTKQSDDEWRKRNYQYVIQIGTYLWMAEKLGKHYDYGILAFVSKDDSFIGKELVVELDDKLRATIESRIATLSDYLERDIPPICECEGWKVEYCNYGDPGTQITNKNGKIVNTRCCDGSWIKKGQ